MKKKTIEEIKPAIELGDEYELLSKIYINDRSKLEILHKFCGFVFWKTWNTFKQGHKCPECGHKKNSLDRALPFDFVKEQIELGNEYKLLSEEYIRCNSKLKILHLACGRSFWMSWTCFNQGRRCKKCHFESISGENHHNWNPNLTDEERLHRDYNHKNENNQWRKAVYERDDHTCQKCFVKGSGKNLNAHHILPWALFPELRFEVENGITLCKTCHKRYHKVWGHGEGCNHKTMKLHLIYNHETMEIMV